MGGGGVRVAHPEPAASAPCAERTYAVTMCDQPNVPPAPVQNDSRRGPDQLDLPPAFVTSNGEDPAWVAALPDLIRHQADRWSLTVHEHFPGIRINYVAPATGADGGRCVLKVSRFVDETRSEIAAL